MSKEYDKLNEECNSLKEELPKLKERILEQKELNDTLEQTKGLLWEENAKLKLEVIELRKNLASFSPAPQIRPLTEQEKNKSYSEVKGSTIKVYDN
jgi:regulator of replication initiation timing